MGKISYYTGEDMRTMKGAIQLHEIQNAKCYDGNKLVRNRLFAGHLSVTSSGIYS